MSDSSALGARRRAAGRTALAVGVVALAIYSAFLLTGVFGT